jgi:hypothetical protein
VPVVDRVGRTGDVSWSAESLMPGDTPRGLTPKLFTEVASFALSLPRGAGPPTAFGEDVRALAARLPRHAVALHELFERHDARLSQLPSVLRHGDLWTGNLLVERGRLSGVVDWDAWHPAAVPGTDLLHIVGPGTTQRSRTAPPAIGRRSGSNRRRRCCSPWGSPGGPGRWPSTSPGSR